MIVTPYPARLTQWIWLNGRGGVTPSQLSCTSVPASRATSASARTHCDLAASADQTTTTARAARSRASMASMGLLAEVHRRAKR